MMKASRMANMVLVTCTGGKTTEQEKQVRTNTDSAADSQRLGFTMFLLKRRATNEANDVKGIV